MAGLSTVRCPLLTQAVSLLGELAPTSLAGSWDNVGLLVDAVTPTTATPSAAYTVLFTNDLTPRVLEEAVDARASLIVTYHPTPFMPMKKFSMASFPARVVLTCARHNIAVYSPHTASDSVPGGVNDWLVDGIGSALAAAGATTAAEPLPRKPVKPAEAADAAAAGAGDGRIATLPTSVTLADMVRAVKQHLGLDTVQLALPLPAPAPAGSEATLETVLVNLFAVCAGSGASVLGGVKADVYVTGEMSHHEVLAATYAGAAVILTHHSKCERGFLTHFASRFSSAWAAAADAAAAGSPSLPPVQVLIAKKDADPLEYV